jgi:hypothetical protein
MLPNVANGPAGVVDRNSSTGLLAQLLPLAPGPRGRLKFADAVEKVREIFGPPVASEAFD